ncbi:MAG: M23 family metallopeptidase, partial [Treponemataceae bacterium]|nr:M23 family metallopeptidase [Treponemataceae bacterium]
MDAVQNAALALISIIGRNAAKILSACAAAAGILLAAAGISSAAQYVRDYTGPLAFQHDESAESAVLSSIMAAFALEESGTYTSDGTLLGEGGAESAAQPFTQPVSYQTYRVQPGDTIIGITKKFGLTNISTLIAVNDIDNVRQLAAGQKLKIPSIDGLLYTVQDGNSLSGISAKFNIALEDLLDVNELESADLTAGQQLFIPGAKLASDKLRQAMGELFKCPISAAYRVSSYFGRRADPFTGAPSSHTGIDLACPQGTPISASASGRVVFVGYSNVFGNYIIINHGNGYQTLYGHMSKTIAQKNQW